MKILIYRYGGICEPDIISAFNQIGLDVIEEKTELTRKNVSNSERVKMVADQIRTHSPLFVFSINFYPALAEVCELLNTLYLCWTVDSPVPELFSESIKCKTNRIFLFDYEQYKLFSPYNKDNIFYLPLASCVERFNSVISTISLPEIDKYSSDISFVGSLYNEKSPLNRISLSDYATGYIDALIESSLMIYGYNPIPDSVSQPVIDEIKAADKNFFSLEKSVCNSDSYVASHSYIGMKAAEVERIKTFNELAKYFSVDLYTRSDTSDLLNVKIHGGVETLSEMPKIFHLSKINLNITIKPIQSGLPLRIFDILGCGGFLMTNYQSELPEYFKIGSDIEAYSSIDELIEKCHFYLSHEDERRKISHNGYCKVKQSHLYINRIKSMLETI